MKPNSNGVVFTIYANETKADIEDWKAVLAMSNYSYADCKAVKNNPA